jgi:hypothetical protein
MNITFNDMAVKKPEQTRLAVQPAPVRKTYQSHIGHDGAEPNVIMKTVFNNTAKSYRLSIKYFFLGKTSRFPAPVRITHTVKVGSMLKGGGKSKIN